MTSAVQRVVAANAAVTADPLRQPDVFERTTFIVLEIEDAAIKALGQIIALKAARAGKDAAGMRAATADIKRLLGQAGQMLDTVDRVTTPPTFQAN